MVPTTDELSASIPFRWRASSRRFRDATAHAFEKPCLSASRAQPRINSRVCFSNPSTCFPKYRGGSKNRSIEVLAAKRNGGGGLIDGCNFGALLRVIVLWFRIRSFDILNGGSGGLKGIGNLWI